MRSPDRAAGNGKSAKMSPILRDIFWLSAAFAIFLLLVRLIGSKTICAFKTFTGLPCPGCGLTHSALALLAGDWMGSWRYHPGLGLALTALLVLSLHKIPLIGKIYRRPFFWLAIFLGMVLIFIVRLILYFPDGPYPITFSTQSMLFRIYEFIR